MFGEFVFRNRVYEVKNHVLFDEHVEKKRYFHSPTEVCLLFDRIEREDGWAFSKIRESAEWHYDFLCRSPKHCSAKPTVQQSLDQLCKKIFEGEMILVEKRQFFRFGGTVHDVLPEKCCIDLIDEINNILSRGNFLAKILVSVGILKALFYPPKKSNLASMLSTAVTIHGEEWELLVKSIQGVPEMTRQAISKLARDHAHDHIDKNSHVSLVRLWEGVADVFGK